MADIQGAKAIAVVQNHRITEQPFARVFNVAGSGQETYTVVVGALGDTEAARDVCTCEAGKHGRRCYHVRAAHLLMTKQRDEARAAVEARS